MSLAEMPINYDYLLGEFQSLRTQMSEQHQRLRSDMNVGFDRMRAELNVHTQEDHEIADRVLVIETQRHEEAKQAIKRGTWAGMVAAFGLTALWEVLKFYATGHLK